MTNETAQWLAGTLRLNVEDDAHWEAIKGVGQKFSEEEFEQAIQAAQDPDIKLALQFYLFFKIARKEDVYSFIEELEAGQGLRLQWLARHPREEASKHGEAERE